MSVCGISEDFKTTRFQRKGAANAKVAEENELIKKRHTIVGPPSGGRFWKDKEFQRKDAEDAKDAKKNGLFKKRHTIVGPPSGGRFWKDKEFQRKGAEDAKKKHELFQKSWPEGQLTRNRCCVG